MVSKMVVDRIILGAGIYGLYSALLLAGSNPSQKIYVLEYDKGAFSRATYINQARVHMGYHYPRSISTAKKSAGYFKRFVEEFEFCIHKSFDQIYAISRDFSWTNEKQFEKFCQNAGIRCDGINVSKYFKDGMVSGGYLTEEYTYDAKVLKEWFLHRLNGYKNVCIIYKQRIREINREGNCFYIQCEGGEQYVTDYLVNATYASTNIVSEMAGGEKFNLKYELCEIILCDAGDMLKEIGITVMDGPFFSIMPFGKTGLHSLTSVTFTPHMACHSDIPDFPCQRGGNSEGCQPLSLGNCNQCSKHPKTSWDFMARLAQRYMKPEYHFSYAKSLYSIKPILEASEIDDSRPTVIKRVFHNPTYIAILSGKINTIYDLEEVLLDE